MKRFLLILALILTSQALSCWFNPCLATTSHKKKTPKPSQAIRITSDRMEAVDQEGKVIFIGNVIAKRGELTIYADRIEVYYDRITQKKGAHSKRKLQKIIATGHLKILQGNRKAKAKTAIYYKPQEKIVLLKDAVVWDGPNSIQGDKITLFVNENRSVVESKGKKRVEAVVYSD